MTRKLRCLGRKGGDDVVVQYVCGVRNTAGAWGMAESRRRASRSASRRRPPSTPSPVPARPAYRRNANNAAAADGGGARHVVVGGLNRFRTRRHQHRAVQSRAAAPAGSEPAAVRRGTGVAPDPTVNAEPGGAAVGVQCVSVRCLIEASRSGLGLASAPSALWRRSVIRFTCPGVGGLRRRRVCEDRRSP